jgi:hypothetical protein
MEPEGSLCCIYILNLKDVLVETQMALMEVTMSEIFSLDEHFGKT